MYILTVYYHDEREQMPFGDRVGGRAGFGDEELADVHFVHVQLYRDDERRQVNDAIDHEPYEYLVRRVLQRKI